MTAACMPVMEYVDYDVMAGDLTRHYVETANSDYIGPEYVADGVLTEEGKAALSEVLLRANVDRDLLVVALAENEALKEVVKEMGKREAMAYLKGMGLGAVFAALAVVLILLVEADVGLQTA
ncbi:MAG: hypothetical protein JW885_02735 [Deltaproteobacteria bacterium]|nr:hypothetical protein [Candidatus Zymogenaceae bacterium]